MRLADVDALLAAGADVGITNFTYLPGGLSRAAAVERVQRAWRERATGVAARFAIADADTDTMIGWVGAGFEWRHEVAEAFYALLPQARGRGIATVALSSVARWVFTTLRIARVELLIDPVNDASRAVATRAGFEYEGVMRSRLLMANGRTDASLYARLATDGR